MKIQAKKNQIENEIDTLYESIESFKNEQTLKKEELSNLMAELNEKNEVLSGEIKNAYSRKRIQNKIVDFYTVLNTIYCNEFNAKLVEDDGKFKEHIYNNIFDSSIESIIQPMPFKHNKIKIKAKVWFNLVLFLAVSILFFYLSYEFCRKLSYYNGYEYTFWGWILNILGAFSALFSMVALTTLSTLKSEAVIALIQNSKNVNIKEIMDYLNSIHKLPSEIKSSIK